MSKNVRTPESCIREFINEEFVHSKEYTRQKCEWSLYRSKRALEAGGFDASPQKIDVKAVEYFLYVAWKGKLVSYKKSELSYLKRYLKFYKNDVIRKMKIVFPQDMRVNVHWLDEEQYQKLLSVEMTPLQRMVIHLELCMGLRNAECCRLTLKDIYNNGTKPYLNVRGKGRGEGKYRTVRFHRDTKEVLRQWLEERERIVNTVRAYDKFWQDPGTLLLWCHYKDKPQAGEYKEHTGALDDAVLDPLREKVGFHFCNHDLRSTFGRRLYHAQVPIETISKFLGHESTVETLKYLGINLDDMDAGMGLLDVYDAKMGCNRGTE
ncbi:MAG: site-specific integrase [Candidatus Methanarcanum hacksteinii]|nr:site-specific integrase [Candidatus Methanarcanum hacksteinii]